MPSCDAREDEPFCGIARDGTDQIEWEQDSGRVEKWLARAVTSVLVGRRVLYECRLALQPNQNLSAKIVISLPTQSTHAKSFITKPPTFTVPFDISFCTVRAQLFILV